MQSATDKVVKLHNEQGVLIRTLKLWEHTEEAGYAPERVQAFSFRPEFLTNEERSSLGRKLGDRSACETHFNCVRVEGEIKKIPLIERPEVPS